MTDINWLDRVKETTFSIKNVIDGQLHDVGGIAQIEKRAPYDGQVLYTFGEGTTEEVDHAVNSARKAFEDGRWSKQSIAERQAVLQKLADLIEDHREEFGLYECLDVGKPITMGLDNDVATATDGLRSAAQCLDNMVESCGVHSGGISYQHRKPIGVVAGIIGWNYPLVLAVSKIGPALAMGNSLVLKPSEFTSLSACRLAQLALEAGVPAGVLNVVHGAGKVVGPALSHHSDVDMITFTGSSQTGKQLMVAAGNSNMKRVHLECGGKSPFIIFDDCPADLDWMAQQIVDMSFPNQGALCISSTRIMMQQGIKAKLMDRILNLTADITPQHPLDPATTFGAIINEDHMNKVLGYVERGNSEGASHLYGGERVMANSGGYYLTPAIFDDVKPNHTIAQEETFGPLMPVFTFDDEAQALKMANNSIYGLAAHIATENLSRAHWVSHSLNVGAVLVYGHSESEGGYIELGAEPQRQSGMGVEGGQAGLEAFSVCSSIHMMI